MKLCPLPQMVDHSIKAVYWKFHTLQVCYAMLIVNFNY